MERYDIKSQKISMDGLGIVKTSIVRMGIVKTAMAEAGNRHNLLIVILGWCQGSNKMIK
jgi:hypothetical protein